MTTETWARLPCDVGGAFARVAGQDRPGVASSHVGSWLCNEYDSLHDAMRHHFGVNRLPTPHTRDVA